MVEGYKPNQMSVTKLEGIAIAGISELRHVGCKSSAIQNKKKIKDFNDKAIIFNTTFALRKGKNKRISNIFLYMLFLVSKYYFLVFFYEGSIMMY